jgi:hypothetical protein
MSTANKDEAIKCLGLAQKYLENSNFSLAKKYANKSIGLFATPEASKLLNSITQREAAGASGETRSNTASMHTEESTAGTRHRHTSHTHGPSGSSTKEKGKERAREYTPQQATVVAQIRKCKVTEYYEILGLKKECDENDVKKAYRKVCLSAVLETHADGFCPIHSSHYSYTRIRMAHLELMRHSRVGLFIQLRFTCSCRRQMQPKGCPLTVDDRCIPYSVPFCLLGHGVLGYITRNSQHAQSPVFGFTP